MITPSTSQVALTVPKALERAISAYVNGDWNQAERLSRAVLDVDANAFDALNLLGLITAQTQRASEAVTWLQRAAIIQPDNPMTHGNLGNALSELMRFEEALGSYESALKIKPDFAEVYFSRANALRDLKRVDEAIKSYDKALHLKPDFAEACVNRGIALQEMKRHEDALRSYDQAIGVRADFDQAWYNRGTLLHDWKRLRDALDSINHALRINPNHAEAWCRRGRICHDLNQFEDALTSFGRAATLNPDFAEAHYSRGNTLLGLKRFSEALDCYDSALRITEHVAEVHNNRGVTLHSLKRLDEALASYSRALQVKSNYSEPYVNRGLVLHELGFHDSALESYEQALQIDPDYAAAYMFRGVTCHKLRRFSEAIKNFDRVIEIMPHSADAHAHRGVALHDMKHLDEALESFDRALQINPMHADGHWNASYCHLLKGELKRGWERYQWRWKNDRVASLLGHARHASLAAFGESARGEKSDAATLLVWGEAGIGDKILFSSMLSDAQTLSAQIVVETDVRLVPLMQRSFPNIAFVPPLDTDEILRLHPGINRQIPIGDLGGMLRVTLQDFPMQKAYLQADARRAAEIRHMNHIDSEAVVVGLSWKSRNSQFGEDKSLVLTDMAPLMETISDGVFVCLQYGDIKQDVADFELRTGKRIVVLQGADLYGSMEDLAAAISLCSLVITGSNVTAHMAGALGKDTKVLLPWSTGRIWYWGVEGDRTPWYPSVRLYRQHGQGDWSKAVEDVRQSLQLLSARH